MTIFLCILAYLALGSPPHILGGKEEGSSVPAYAVWVALVLGLSCLALRSYLS